MKLIRAIPIKINKSLKKPEPLKFEVMMHMKYKTLLRYDNDLINNLLYLNSNSKKSIRVNYRYLDEMYVILAMDEDTFLNGLQGINPINKWVELYPHSYSCGNLLQSLIKPFYE